MISHDQIQAASILIVDDEPSLTFYLTERLRRWGYQAVISTNDPVQAVPLIQQHKPDLLLLDLMMPRVTGFEVMALLQLALADVPPILVLTANSQSETRYQALKAGAKDFLTKPLDAVELELRVRNLLESRLLYRALRRQNEALEAQVLTRTEALGASQREVVERLARAAEFHDDETGEHAQRVARNASKIVQALGWGEDRVALMGHAAPLHDIGKIGVPDPMLRRAGPLNPEEMMLMQAHTLIGGRIMAGGGSPLVQMAERIALSHHEWWNGQGYPYGLVGEQIPIEGRIVAIADVFDALMTARPYKDSWPLDRARAELHRLRAQQFDPTLLDLFLSLEPVVPPPLPERRRRRRLTNSPLSPAL